MKEETISIMIKFHNRKFEVIISPLGTISLLKSKIKQTLSKKINLKKCGYDIENISEGNIVVQKLNSPILILSEEFDNKTIKDCGLVDGEQLDISIVKSTSPHNKNEKESIDSEKITNKEEQDFSKYSVYRKIIPGDNSCMFNAVNYALNQCLSEPEILRQLISAEIKSNPELYNEAVLEIPSEKYCDWIMRKNSWGGGIELSILSNVFRVRIDVVDILNNTIEMIGDMYTKVIYLLYNGSHYDVFMKKEKDGREIGVFEVSDKATRKEVTEIANEIKKMAKNVDTEIFKLKCDKCNSVFVNEGEAASHSKSSGHTNYSQTGTVL